MSWIMRTADNSSRDSVAHRLRSRRFGLFRSLIASIPGDLRVLDVGGRAAFWNMMGGVPEGLSITLLNVEEIPDVEGFESVQGDARDMQCFEDRAFDVVFSNSVIEHVGGWQDQVVAAAEMRRVGHRYFVQTPNRYFPIEPHFLFPFWQFLPESIRAHLHGRFRLGWVPPAPDYAAALQSVRQIRLLTKREIGQLFPGATIYTERFAGLAKSFVAYGGW